MQTNNLFHNKTTRNFKIDLNIGDIYRDFKVIEKKLHIVSSRLKIIEGDYFTIECTHCQYTKKGFVTIFRKTMECPHCIHQRKNKEESFIKDNWTIYFTPINSITTRKKGYPPKFKWLCNDCGHVFLKPNCTPKIETKVICTYCTPKQQKLKKVKKINKNKTPKELLKLKIEKSKNDRKPDNYWLMPK